MKRRGKPATLRKKLVELTAEQLKESRVRFPFKDGTCEVLPATVVKDALDRQIHELRRAQGSEGGRPSKASPEIKAAILLKFSDYWLTRSDKMPLLRARAHARAWIVAELLDTCPGISAATARRWVAEVLGKKEAMPKNYRRK